MSSDEDAWLPRMETNDSSESEKFIQYMVSPSLENIALVSITISLWGNPNLDASDYSLLIKEYKILEKGFFKKLDKIDLPVSLKIKVSQTFSLFDWQLYEQSIYDSEENRLIRIMYEDRNLRYSNAWSPRGWIDERKSLEKLIKILKNQRVKEEHLCLLYQLACHYCLEEYIPDLWSKVSNKDKLFNFACSSYSSHLTAYWTAVQEKQLLPGLVRKLQEQYPFPNNIYDYTLSIYVNMVYLSFNQANMTAFMFFWKKLTEEEKYSENQKLLKVAVRRLSSNKKYIILKIACFLLSQLNDGRSQREFLRKRSNFSLFKGLIEYLPLKRIFLSTITVIMDFLNECYYVHVMESIVYRMKPRLYSVATEILLREVWYLSPLKLKKAIIRQHACLARAIANLMSVNDNITINLILKDASAPEREGIAFAMVKDSNCLDFLLSNTISVSTIESFLSELLSSESDRQMLRRDMIKFYLERIHIFISYHYEGEHKILEILLELLNRTFQSDKEIREFKQNCIDPFKMFTSLLRILDFESLNNFLKWYFETEEEIKKFKKSLPFVNKFPSDLLLSFSYRETDGWSLFQNFMSNFCDYDKDIKELKRTFLENSGWIMGYAFRKHDRRLQFFNSLLNWCHDSPDSLNHLKNKIFLQEGISTLLAIMKSMFPDWNRVRDILKWVSPFTYAAIVKVRSLQDSDFIYDSAYFLDGYTARNRRLAFFYLFDSLVESEYKSECDRDGYASNNPYLSSVMKGGETALLNAI